MPRTDTLLRAYLVVGENELKRMTTLDRLRAYVNDDLADFNLDERSASALESPEELLSSLETLPFGTSIRLVILRDIKDPKQLDKPIIDALLSYLAHPNPHCVLCLECQTIDKRSRLYKTIAKQGKQAVIDCAPLKRWELPEHVVRLAKAHGLSLSERAAAELVNRVGESTLLLDKQLETLSELVGKKRSIGIEDIRAHVARVAEPREWDLLDALCERDLTTALALYHSMKTLVGNKTAQSRFLWFSNTRVRELICAKSCEAHGELFRLGEKLGKKQWQVKNHGRWARTFEEDELCRLLASGAACERALKSSGDSESAFITYLLEFCATRQN